MGESKNTSEAQPSCRGRNPKPLPMSPFPFLVSLDFLTIMFLVSFMCRLVEGEPRPRRRNDETAAPRYSFIGRVLVFAFFDQQRPPNLFFACFYAKLAKTQPKPAENSLTERNRHRRREIWHQNTVVPPCRNPKLTIKV